MILSPRCLAKEESAQCGTAHVGSHRIVAVGFAVAYVVDGIFESFDDTVGNLASRCAFAVCLWALVGQHSSDIWYVAIACHQFHVPP